jgi:hypothetical protein
VTNSRAAIAILAVLLVACGGSPKYGGVSPVNRACPAEAPIKGNVNQQGERIYHVPGGEFYARTNPETCFSSESSARAAGFRASLR